MVLNHTIILNLRILYVLPYTLTNSWVLDCSNILNPYSFALVEVLVVGADEHFFFTADEDLLVVRLEPILCVLGEEVALF